MSFTWDIQTRPYIFVWLTVLTKEYAPLIIQDLVDLGHEITAIKPGLLTLGENPKVSSVMAIKIAYTCSYEQLSKDFGKVIYNNKVCYYSIVILTSEGLFSWGPGNMQLSSDMDVPPNSKKPRPDYLRLVETNDIPTA